MIIKTIPKIILSLALFTLLTASRPIPEKQSPNIILILADDLGIGLLGHEGQKIIKTPHIDRLAAEGMRFTHAYSNMLCAPSRASLITGLHDSHQNRFQITAGGIYDELNDRPELAAQVERAINASLKPIPKQQVFLGQVAQEKGYTTGQIGKLEWGFATSHLQMKRHGWDYYLGYLDHQRAHGFYPPFLFEKETMKYYPGNTHPNAGKSKEPETEEAYKERWNMEGKAVYSENIFMEGVMNFLEVNQKQPFFLYFPTQLPHGPVSIPAVHPDFINDNRLTQIEKEYASMVKMLDDHVGQILSKLDELQLTENTIVIFMADNGHEIFYGQKGRTLKPYTDMKTGKKFDDLANKYYSDLAGDVFDGNAGQAGMKRSNLQGGIRIPLIVRWPGHIAANSVSDRLVANYDLLPTIAEITGFKSKIKTDGLSFYEELVRSIPAKKHQHVVYSSYTGPTLITQDGWKIRTVLKADAFELYYLPDDYREENNLAASRPEKLAELKAKLLKACDGDFNNGLFQNKNIINSMKFYKAHP